MCTTVNMLDWHMQNLAFLLLAMRQLHHASYMSRFATLLGGGIRVKFGIREQRKIKMLM